MAWSTELARGELKKIRQFGRMYTLFRGHDGQVGLLDDVCPHLGAHFSDGGCVKGNSVRCPYHHWSFDRTGRCTDIPYAKRIPTKARVGSHTVAERYGMIFMYRNATGTTPAYALPEIENYDPAEFLDPHTYDFTIRIHGQDIMENSVDSPHFWAVHGHAMPDNEFHEEGDELRITQTASVHRFGRTMNFRLEFHMIEPGFHYVHFPTLPGGATALVFSSIVPVDEEYTSHRMTMMIRKSKIPGYARLLRRFINWQMMKTYYEDMEIWESKEYHSRPILCDGDGSIMKLRRWYARFHDPRGNGRGGVEVRAQVGSAPRPGRSPSALQAGRNISEHRTPAIAVHRAPYDLDVGGTPRRPQHEGSLSLRRADRHQRRREPTLGGRRGMEGTGRHVVALSRDDRPDAAELDPDALRVRDHARARARTVVDDVAAGVAFGVGHDVGAAAVHLANQHFAPQIPNVIVDRPQRLAIDALVGWPHV